MWPENYSRASPHGITAEVLDSYLEESEFKLQSRYYVHLRTFWERYEILYPHPTCYGLNAITSALLQDGFGIK